LQVSAASYRPTVSRLVTLASGTIVDAAHIHQFARSRNNALNNGIALLQGRRITLPANPAHRPARQHLAWHRSHKFLGMKDEG
jgi:predicted restriction endonuclease